VDWIQLAQWQAPVNTVMYESHYECLNASLGPRQDGQGCSPRSHDLLQALSYLSCRYWIRTEYNNFTVKSFLSCIPLAVHVTCVAQFGSVSCTKERGRLHNEFHKNMRLTCSSTVRKIKQEGGTCITNKGNNKCTKCWLETPMEKDTLSKLDINDRSTLNWMLQKWMWNTDPLTFMPWAGQFSSSVNKNKDNSNKY